MDVKCTKVPPQCPKYRGGSCTAYKKCKYQSSYTTADRIRAMIPGMSDEQLAEWICRITLRAYMGRETLSTEERLLDLQQPAPEEGEKNV